MISLGVTVIGGLVVYLLTREPSKPIAAESLRYFSAQPTRFELDSGSLSLATARLTNTGDIAAQDIRVSVGLPPGMPILQRSTRLSSREAGTLSMENGPNSTLIITIPMLAPAERLDISLLFRGDVFSPLVINAKSAASLASVEDTLLSGPAKAKKPRSVLVVVAAVIAQGATLFGLFLLRRRFRGSPRDVNNAGFLLLHAGMAERAQDILTSALSRQGADPFILANLALATEYSGNPADADALIRAATFYAASKHEKAVAAFSHSIMDLRRGSLDSGIDKLDRALSLSKSEVTRYCRFSLLVSALRRDSKPLAAALTARSIEVLPAA